MLLSNLSVGSRSNVSCHSKGEKTVNENASDISSSYNEILQILDKLGQSDVEIENITEKFKSKRNHNSENIYRVITVLWPVYSNKSEFKNQGMR